jgi:hypothetical protein
MNDLEQYFRKNNKRLIHKWTHYFDIYERHFNRYRNKEVIILEIGISQGGSLQMWKDYFGSRAVIYGIDVEPKCKELEEENIHIFIGSQSNRKFLRQVKAQIPKVDILIDDGGHTMVQQIVTFEELFNHVKDDGVYLCEDTHTSYWLRYGGGHKRRGTFMEYSKNFIDYLNAWHSEQLSLRVNAFTRTVDSVHYYDSVVVIEKKLREAPKHEKTGETSFILEPQVKTQQGYYYKRVKDVCLSVVNRMLRLLRLPGFIWR